jgi:hypothetical protein
MMMEEPMPELVELILSYIDSISLVACRFVCTAWMHTTPKAAAASAGPEE